MHSAFVQQTDQPVIRILPIITDQLAATLSQASTLIQQWVKQTQFQAESGTFCLVPTATGELETVLLGMKNVNDFRAFGALSPVLPAGVYEITSDFFHDSSQLELATLGWGLGFYQFSTYKAPKPRLAQLLLHQSLNVSLIESQLSAITLARDLINTPAEDMGPEALENAVKTVAKPFSASVNVIVGDALLEKKYPAVHAVGRASVRAPRVIDLRFGNEHAPRVTLVGKGVCFDSGGLDLKNASGMLLMKKDMAGAAMMLALAQMIMSTALPVRLRLLIGAVENAVSGNSYRPGDVVPTRAGKTVEIKNTDAEGRMVLCDLLAEACTEKPDILIDFATLTGAARVALGEDIPAMYTQQQSFADELMKSAKTVQDPIWPMPLIPDYLEKLNSDIADLSNCADSPWGGSITAALFLQAFVDQTTCWAHFDTPAWNFKPKPARPAGGEVFAIRAVFHMLCQRYKK